LVFWRSVLRFQSNKVEPWIALRNTLGVAAPLAVGAAVNSISAALAVSIGALNVAYSDSHEPYIQRVRRMLAAIVAVAGAVFAGTVSGSNHMLAVLVAGGWAFAAGLLVALGSTAGDLWLISLVTLIVFSANPLPAQEAVYSGLLAFGGAIFQTALSLVFWPVRRYVLERQAIGKLFLDLSRAAASAPEVFQSPRATAESTGAQIALSTLGGDHSVEGERYRSLLSQAERAHLSLFALARLRARIQRIRDDTGGLETIDQYLGVSSQALQLIGAALTSGQPAPELSGKLRALQQLSEGMRADGQNGSPEAASILHDANLQINALTGQLRSAAEFAEHVTAGLVSFARRETDKPARFQLEGVLATLRANLTFRSAAFRHAIRLSACVAAGDSLARGFHLPRFYWMPMTVAIVLKQPRSAAAFCAWLVRSPASASPRCCSTFSSWGSRPK
jgi:uncharacterized membrane protein YccC